MSVLVLFVLFYLFCFVYYLVWFGVLLLLLVRMSPFVLFVAVLIFLCVTGSGRGVDGHFLSTCVKS